MTEDYNDEKDTQIDWSSLSQEETVSYCVSTESLLGNIHFPREAAMCRDSMCQSSEHVSDICSMYEDLIKALLVSSQCTCRSKSKKKIKPGCG